MAEFLVIARDNEGVLGKRMEAREEHLARIRESLGEGEGVRVLTGGALLDDAGDLSGSMVVLEAGSIEEARAFMEADAYTREGVYGPMDVYPFRFAFRKG